MMMTLHDPEFPATRDALCDAFKAFAVATGHEAQFVAFTNAQWKDLGRFGNFAERPAKILGAVVLGIDAPFFYLA